jgi:uncharacterized protein
MSTRSVEHAAVPARRRFRAGPLELVVASLLVAALARPWITRELSRPALRNWTTVFQAVFLQAIPFLVLGVVLSGAVAAFVPARAFDRLERLRPGAAVPVAAMSGVLLPGCECGAVPLAGRLINRGLHESAALAFLLASPAINPVVLVATSVAFAGRPAMVVGRFVASLLAASVVGWIWLRLGRTGWRPQLRSTHVHESGWRTFTSTAAHDFSHAGGYLVVGAATAATLQTVVPRSVLDGLAANLVVATISLSVLAVALAICSEADAFVAAGLSQFPLISRLAFLVVGPMVDVKLIAMQRGIFGNRFAAIFAPLAFASAVTSAVIVGSIVL